MPLRPEDLRGPRQDKPLPHFLTREDLLRLLEAPSGDSPLGLRDRALLEKSLEGYSAEEMARDEGITSTGIRVRMYRVGFGDFFNNSSATSKKPGEQ